jgi:hypothetical protein
MTAVGSEIFGRRRRNAMTACNVAWGDVIIVRCVEITATSEHCVETVGRRHVNHVVCSKPARRPTKPVPSSHIGTGCEQDQRASKGTSLRRIVQRAPASVIEHVDVDTSHVNSRR